MRVEPHKAQGGTGVSAGAEGESGVKMHDDRARIRDAFVVRTDPQALAKAHGMKVFQPLALPGAICDGLCVNPRGRNPQVCSQQVPQRAGVFSCGEQHDQTRGRPEAKFPRPRLEHRIIARVHERHRERATLETDLLRGLRIQRAQVE